MYVHSDEGIVTDDGFASRAAGGSISALSVLIRATTDRHQRSVINNVYSLDMTTQLTKSL